MDMNWAQVFRAKQSRWTGSYNDVANAIYDTTNKVVYSNVRLAALDASEDVIYNVTRNAIRNGINGVMFLELCGYE